MEFSSLLNDLHRERDHEYPATILPTVAQTRGRRPSPTRLSRAPRWQRCQWRQCPWPHEGEAFQTLRGFAWMAHRTRCVSLIIPG